MLNEALVANTKPRAKTLSDGPSMVTWPIPLTGVPQVRNAGKKLCDRAVDSQACIEEQVGEKKWTITMFWI
jgi:spore coat protein CotF